jgi:hypothetical protein
MENQSRVRPLCNGKLTNLLLFPEEIFTPPERSPSPNNHRQPECLPLWNPLLSLTHIAAEWPALLKDLGRRRQVLETILTAGLSGSAATLSSSSFPQTADFTKNCSTSLITVSVWKRSCLADFRYD